MIPLGTLFGPISYFFFSNCAGLILTLTGPLLFCFLSLALGRSQVRSSRSFFLSWVVCWALGLFYALYVGEGQTSLETFAFEFQGFKFGLAFKFGGRVELYCVFGVCVFVLALGVLLAFDEGHAYSWEMSCLLMSICFFAGHFVIAGSLGQSWASFQGLSMSTRAFAALWVNSPKMKAFDPAETFEYWIFALTFNAWYDYHTLDISTILGLGFWMSYQKRCHLWINETSVLDITLIYLGLNVLHLGVWVSIYTVRLGLALHKNDREDALLQLACFAQGIVMLLAVFFLVWKLLPLLLLSDAFNLLNRK